MSSSELGMLCYVMLEWNNIQLITPTELLKAASPCFSLRNEHKKKKWQLHSRSDKIHLWSRIMHIGCKEQRWKPCWCISNPLHDCIVCDTWTCILIQKNQCMFLSEVAFTQMRFHLWPHHFRCSDKWAKMVNFGSHLYHHDFVFQAEMIPGINTSKLYWFWGGFKVVKPCQCDTVFMQTLQ